MMLVDANVLLYAYDSECPHHTPARQWFARELSSGRPVRPALITLLAFVRIATDRRVFIHPLSPGDACVLIESWLDQSNVQLLQPGSRTWQLLGAICEETSPAFRASRY